MNIIILRAVLEMYFGWGGWPNISTPRIFTDFFTVSITNEGPITHIASKDSFLEQPYYNMILYLYNINNSIMKIEESRTQQAY